MLEFLTQNPFAIFFILLPLMVIAIRGVRRLFFFLSYGRKKTIKFALLKQKMMAREAGFNRVNWPIAMSQLEMWFTEKSQLLSAEQGRPYLLHLPKNALQNSEPRQFSVMLTRTMNCSTEQWLDVRGHYSIKPNDEERSACLVFRCDMAGAVVVRAYPHSIVNEDEGKEYFVLGVFSSVAKLLESIASNAIEKHWREFVSVSAHSCFGAYSSGLNWHFRDRLERRTRRYQDLLEPSARQREELKIEVALGVGLTAGLFSGVVQLIPTIFPELKGGAEALIPAALMMVFMWILKRMYRR